MQPYLSKDFDYAVQSNYELSAVISHMGSLESGHYICYAKVNSIWFKFDDAFVIKSSWNEVSATSAYLSFYLLDICLCTLRKCNKQYFYLLYAFLCFISG